MERNVFFFVVLVSTAICLIGFGVGAKNEPKIFAKDGSVYIRSGDNGNIVFEHPSTEGKVFVAGQELNVINSTGPKGDKGASGPPGQKGTLGDKGEPGVRGDMGTHGFPGTNGTTGPPGTKGDHGALGPKGSQGPPGIQGAPGQNGTDGSKGEPGPQGDSGAPGGPGSRGPEGPIGVPGLNGTVGEKGVNGSQGPPGVKGAKGDTGDTSYFRGNETDSIQCNSSNLGLLRYSLSKLQLCTPRGWRYLSFDEPVCNMDSTVPNVPKTNYEAFRNAELGIMFQFNTQFEPSVIAQANLNITAEMSNANSTLTYQDGVMRQAAIFSGKQYLNILGLSDDFWKNSNWSVMALLKFRDIGQQDIMVLGHGTESNNKGLHLGIRGKDKKVLHGYYSNDLVYAVVKEDTWYHITWTSEKNLRGEETRCIIVNGNQHNCEPNSKGRYEGIGTTTVGTWWHRLGDNGLLLDNLIITSGIVRYRKATEGDKQVCFAKALDDNIP